jgi:hypothetical protein
MEINFNISNTVREVYRRAVPISDALDPLVRARLSNPHWFEALIGAAMIQYNRRAKYSGGDFEEQDGYTNFIRVASLMSISVRRVFRFYIAQKVARIMVSQTDHDDERYLDTLRDLANYALLAAGWEMRSEEDKHQAILKVLVAED